MDIFKLVWIPFLAKVLLKFGFSDSFVNWTLACISHPWIAPLINGRPKKKRTTVGMLLVPKHSSING